MRLLAIDTTTMLGSVALTDGQRIVAQEQQGVAGTHSERLLVTIDHLLAIAGWERGAIEGIAVAIGPGSFTGLRIGLATAKGMAMALNCPIAGVSSLASLAENGSAFAGTVAALIDARRGELYVSATRFGAGGKAKQVLKPCVLPPEALVAKLKGIKGPMLLVGDGALAYAATLSRALGKRAKIAAGGQCLPQAANLAMLALTKLARGKGDDLAALAPDYIRRSDAEIGFNVNHAKRRPAPTARRGKRR